MLEPDHEVSTPSFCSWRSHRRRYSIPADPPRATLQRSIGLLDRGDEDFCARLQIALVPLHVNDDGRVGRDKDFLFSVLVFQRQRLPVNRSDNLFYVRVGHCALRPKILAGGSLAVAALRRGTRTTPLVFLRVADPGSQGFVASLAHPGAHLTGFFSPEYALSAQLL